MNAPVSWTLPNVRDVVLLANFPGQNTGPHFALVVGVFKLPNDLSRYVIVAPGTSIKTGHRLDAAIELPVQAGVGGVGAPTKFYFDLLQLYEYPSEAFIESNKPRIQPNQVTSVVGSLDPSKDYLNCIRAEAGDILNLYRNFLARYDINLGSCLDVSTKRPKGFFT